MRLLHTADWHLGRSLHGVDLLEHQAAFLDHLVDLARVSKVSAVLVSGDVYDRAVPPVQAVSLLSATLRRLTEFTQVVLISGNHDSATRLGFGAEVMRPGLHLVTQVARVGQAIELGISADAGPCLVYPLPYLDVDLARGVLAEGEEPLARSHQAVVGAAMDRVRADLARRRGRGGKTRGQAGTSRPGMSQAAAKTVVLAHAFVAGGAASESERDIRVGGIDVVPASLFAGVDYVALGHLHGPQVVNAGAVGPVMRYAGSPLALSFSEMGQVKSSVLVDFTGAEVGIELIPAPVPRPLNKVTGTLSELLGSQYDAVADDWLWVTVTDPARPQDLMQRLDRRFAHRLVTRHVPEGTASASPAGPRAQVADPMAVAAEFVAYAGGVAPNEAERAALGSALEATLTERGA